MDDVTRKINSYQGAWDWSKMDPEFDKLVNEYNGLDGWFKMYDTQIAQYNRCVRLGIEYDNKYGTISELDTQAVANAKRMSELSQLIINYEFKQ